MQLRGLAALQVTSKRRGVAGCNPHLLPRVQVLTSVGRNDKSRPSLIMLRPTLSDRWPGIVGRLDRWTPADR